MSTVGAYSLVRPLGAGAYSKVWLAQAASGEYVALKSTLVAQHADKKQVESFQRAQEEASYMKLLSHPNLVPVLGSLTENHEGGAMTFHLVLPYYAGGDLLDYLRRKRYLPENEARHYFVQICSAVNHMHTSGVIHRDLKLENFFLSSDGRHCYVGDFGFAGTWARDKMQNKSWGSIHYASPEICSSSAYMGPEVDLWSLGVVLYALLCGKLPFNGDNDFAIYQQIVAANVQLPATCTPDAAHLIKGLLNPNRILRMEMSQVLAHPWVQQPAATPAPSSPQLERHRSSETLVTPLNMDRLHQRRGSNALSIKETTRRSSMSGPDDEQRSPTSSSSSSPKSAGSRFESPTGSPRDVSRRPSRFININGGRRFSISQLASKIVHAVSPGRTPSPSSHTNRPASPAAVGSPPTSTSPVSRTGVFPADSTP